MRRRLARLATAWAVAIACASCGDDGGGDAACRRTDAAEQFVLAPGERHDVAGGLTAVALRTVHDTYSRRDGVDVTTAPYVAVGDQWLELTNTLTLAYREDTTVRVDLLGCTTDEVRYDDYSVRVQTDCEVRVIRQSCRTVAEIAPEAIHWVARLGSRYAKTATPRKSLALVAIRSTGFDVGWVDRTVDPWEVKTAHGGLDLVTAFGVVNMELDDGEPVIGHIVPIEIGPYRGAVRITDIANSNTRCTFGCFDVLDVEVILEPTSRAPILPRILSYE